jgi:hypothetical protein
MRGESYCLGFAYDPLVRLVTGAAKSIKPGPAEEQRLAGSQGENERYQSGGTL